MRDILYRYDACSLSFAAGIGWLVLHKVEEYFPHLRQPVRAFGVVGFLGTAAYGFAVAQPTAEGELLGLALAALIGAEAAALVAVLVVPPLTAVRDAHRSWSLSVRLAAEDRSRRRAEARAKRERELAWERERPERERREREWAEEKRHEADAQRRRENARSECLLYYHLHAPEIDARFPRAKYDEYVRAYLRDDVPPEDVERQAAKLLGLMEGHLERAGKAERPADVGALAAWYAEMKGKIDAADAPADAKDVQLALLYERYHDLIEKHMREVRP